MNQCRVSLIPSYGLIFVFDFKNNINNGVIISFCRFEECSLSLNTSHQVNNNDLLVDRDQVYILCCVYRTSVTSTDKHIAAEAQISSKQFSDKALRMLFDDDIFHRLITFERNRNTIRRLTNNKIYIYGLIQLYTEL